MLGKEELKKVGGLRTITLSFTPGGDMIHDPELKKFGTLREIKLSFKAVENGYEKPKLTRYGTFRDITLAGVTGASDGYWVCGDPCVSSPPTNAGPDRSA